MARFPLVPTARQTQGTAFQWLIRHFNPVWPFSELSSFGDINFFSLIILILANCFVLLVIFNYIQEKLGVQEEKQTCAPASYTIRSLMGQNRNFKVENICKHYSYYKNKHKFLDECRS